MTTATLSVDQPAAVTVSQAAKMLNVSRAAMYDHIARGEIQSVRLGRRYLIPVHRLRAFLEGEIAGN